MAQTDAQKKVVKRWIKALRSGEYKQSQNYLVQPGKKVDSFCCLGVLCDMAVIEGVIAPPRLIEGAEPRFVYDGHATGLPFKVSEWAGIRGSLGSYNVDRSGSLAHLNDDGVPFSYIADVIERKPEMLFV